MGNFRQRIFNNKTQLELIFAEEVSRFLQSEINKSGKATLLLSGGSTPNDLYKTLSEIDIDWAKVTVGLVDERFVTPNSKDSNEKLIKESFLQNKAAKANFIGMVFNHDNYDENLTHAINNNETFFDSITCCLLGMGKDGHTASLFPNPDIDYTDDKLFGAKNIINTTSNVLPFKRISFTKAALLRSKHLFLYFNGEEKINVFQSAKNCKKDNKLPISSFIHQQYNVLNVYCSFKL